jgi:hypothetical protein
LRKLSSAFADELPAIRKAAAAAAPARVTAQQNTPGADELKQASAGPVVNRERPIFGMVYFIVYIVACAAVMIRWRMARPYR